MAKYEKYFVSSKFAKVTLIWLAIDLSTYYMQNSPSITTLKKLKSRIYNLFTKIIYYNMYNTMNISAD